jgi:hypothetical protein
VPAAIASDAAINVETNNETRIAMSVSRLEFMGCPAQSAATAGAQRPRKKKPRPKLGLFI